MSHPAERGILDTSTLVDLVTLDPAQLPAEPLITAITLAELSIGPLVARSEDVRAARQSVLQQAEADFDPIPFDGAAARAFGRVASSLRLAGRKPAARAYDALIAATAIAHELPLFTSNPADFRGITELHLQPVEPGDSGVPGESVAPGS